MFARCLPGVGLHGVDLVSLTWCLPGVGLHGVDVVSLTWCLPGVGLHGVELMLFDLVLAWWSDVVMGLEMPHPPLQPPPLSPTQDMLRPKEQE